MQHLFPLLALALAATLLPVTALADHHEADDDAEAAPKHIVFVTGDEEYRSEESMPMLGRILHERFGYRVTVCYSLADDGTIDPNNTRSITGLEALEDADLMVMFTRFRALPDDQLAMITDYVDSGRPVAGFRTATHAFRYPDGHDHAAEFNHQWPRNLFGQGWITHHGHHGDNTRPLTSAAPIGGETGSHPVLRGVHPFQAFSWVYHVQGGGDTLAGDATPLVRGWSLVSGHERAGRTDRFPLQQPVAWVKTHTGTDGTVGRVFFSTVAHPYDFRSPDCRRLSLQGILWALGDEDRIPNQGVNPDTIGEYDPAPSGFGQVFKQGVTPQPIGD